MTHEPESFEHLLLDLHLDQLEPEQADRVREAMESFPDLADKNNRLAHILSLLDKYPAPQPRAGLTESVLARVESHSAIYPFEQPVSAQTARAAAANTGQELSAGPVLSLRELIAIAACITLFVGIFVPGYYKAQDIAIRNRCMDNLRQVWSGANHFAEANNGYLAHAGYSPGASWLPTRAPNVKRYSNTAYVYKLVKDDYVRDTMVFLCPADPTGRPMRADNYKDFDDFAERANSSYSYLFMNVPKPRRLVDLDESGNGRVALAGDRNPLFDSAAAVRLNPYDETTGNSPTHENGAGQNVVYLNGRAGWFTRPNVGVNEDNIYKAGKLLRYTGTEAPVCPTDTLLVP